MMVIQQALLYTYTCVLLIKQCDLGGATICGLYGLGDDSHGELMRRLHWLLRGHDLSRLIWLCLSSPQIGHRIIRLLRLLCGRDAPTPDWHHRASIVLHRQCPKSCLDGQRAFHIDFTDFWKSLGSQV
jgi:hypothetical protein